MKGYYISVKNDLLDPKHKLKMGSSVWEYMWLLDKMTSITEEGIGRVLGGAPIKLMDIQEALGGGLSTISNNLNRLEREEYISVKRVPYGLIINVFKAAKTFGIREKRIRKSVREYGNPKQTTENRSLIKTIQDNTMTYRDHLKNWTGTPLGERPK